MESEFNYSNALALFDFVPVAISAIAFIIVAKIISQQKIELTTLSFISVALIILGGVSKAFWKLIVATLQLDISILNTSLFVFMAPGFTLLAYCCLQLQVNGCVQERVRSTIFIPLSIISVFLSMSYFFAWQNPESKLWFICLLILVTVSNITFIYQIARYAWAQHVKFSSLLFIGNLIGTFGMSALARVGDSSEGFQWTAQILNTFTQSMLLIAAWTLWKNTKNVSSDTSI